MEDHDPFDALITTMLAVAVLAKSIGLPRQTLQEGVGAAFDSLSEATPHATH
jgi:Flp pilus assembly pilin Flp